MEKPSSITRPQLEELAEIGRLYLAANESGDVVRTAMTEQTNAYDRLKEAVAQHRARLDSASK